MSLRSPDNLATGGAARILDWGFRAVTCRNPGAFQRLLTLLLEMFPAESFSGGYGWLENPAATLWSGGGAPAFRIERVVGLREPRDYLQFYLRGNLLIRDAHFYACLRTRRPQVWIDVYKAQRNLPAFDPQTRSGFDPLYLEAVFDHRLAFKLRSAFADDEGRVFSFALYFRRATEARRFARLFEAVVPYLQIAILNAYGTETLRGIDRDGSPLYLSEREIEVLKWLAEGKTSWEIGVILNISERTVKFHVQNLMRRLGAANRHHLVALSFEKSIRGLFERDARSVSPRLKR